MKTLRRALLILVAAAAFAVVWGVAELKRYADQPLQTSRDPVAITIRPGQGLSEVTQMLSRAGLVQHPFKFQMLARVKGWERKLQAGKYVIEGDITPRRILEKMVHGRVHLNRITIPEGYTVNQIAAMLAQSDFKDAADFPRTCASVDFRERHHIEGATCEGYLFPDTYYFPDDAGADTMADAMASRFWEVFKAEWIQRAADSGLSVHQVVTLASIIEKETGDGRERALISSVFHNRLKHGMRLESDPTVIYGLKNFDGNLTRTHLRSPSPYNTYTINGLPPGPIANPGEAALAAALYPVNTPYLFFVSRNDGTHHFSKDFTEHNRAVNKYQPAR